MTFFIRFFLVFLLYLLTPAPGIAALLEATSFATASCHAGTRQQVAAVPSVATVTCDDATPGVVSTAAAATGFGGIFPEVGSATASARLQRGDAVGAESRVFGSSSVFYYFAVEQTDTPPSAPSSVPLRFHASGEVKVSGSSTTPSSAGVSIAGFGSDLFEALSVELEGSGAVSFDGSVGISVEIDRPYLVSVFALCALGLSERNTSGTCEATVDPFFTFDQQVFDDGNADPFMLDAFYKVVYSSNVRFEPRQDVPEPAVLGLLCSAIGLLFLGAGRRHIRGAVRR